MTSNFTIQQLCYEWLQCSTFKDSSHIPSTNFLPHLIPLKTFQYISTYPRIILGIWNNLSITSRPGRGAKQVEKSQRLNWATQILTVAYDCACPPDVSVTMT